MSERKVLILIPGSLNDARVWEAQIAGLSAHADIRIADITSQESTASMAAAVLAGAPQRFALAGFSLGGYVALEVLRIAAPRITGLALISSSARPEHPDAVPGREKMIALAQRDFPRMLGGMRPFMLAAANTGNADLNTRLDEMMVAVGPATFVRQSRAVIGRADSRDLLAGISCPTLIACGREDRVTPPALSEEMAAAIPNARLELVDNAAHMLPMETPDSLTHLMRRWLDTTSP